MPRRPEWRPYQNRKRVRTATTDAVPGFAARRIAADIVDGVLRRNRALDEQLDGATANAGLAALPDRDRALTRALVATVLRRLGTLRHLIGVFLEHGLPAKAPRSRPRSLSARRKFFSSTCPTMPPSISPSALTQADRNATHYAGLVNAVLRRIAREGAERLAALDASPRHAGMADGALDQGLRRGDRPRHRLPPMAASRRSI